MHIGKMAANTYANAKAGAIAGTTTTYTTTVAVPGVLKGKWTTEFAIKTNAASPTLDWNTGIAFLPLAIKKGCVFVWGFLAAGTVKVVQGPIVDLDPANDAFVIRPQFPPIPDDMVPFAYTLVANGAAGAAWTFGVSNWSATAAVDTWVDIAFLPERPQVL